MRTRKIRDEDENSDYDNRDSSALAFANQLSTIPVGKNKSQPAGAHQNFDAIQVPADTDISMQF